jgi:hypothetical protein
MVVQLRGRSCHSSVNLSTWVFPRYYYGLVIKSMGCPDSVSSIY